MESTGARLKKLRLEKGFSLEEVHKKTKIHLNVLKAIEEDSLVNFNPVYIKGFLKIYCGFLGVDFKEYVSDVKKAHTHTPVDTLSEKKKEKPLPIVKLSPFMPGMLDAIRSKLKIVVLAGVVLAAAVILFQAGKFIFSKAKLLSRRTKVSMKAHVPAQEKKIYTIKPQETKEPTAAVPNLKKQEEISSGVRVGVRAKEDCWMKVKLDGKVIFQNILKKGRLENWQAKEKIELALGNAGAVELEVNGKLISSVGRRGQAMKNIVVTKDGLSTSR